MACAVGIATFVPPTRLDRSFPATAAWGLTPRSLRRDASQEKDHSVGAWKADASERGDRCPGLL